MTFFRSLLSRLRGRPAARPTRQPAARKVRPAVEGLETRDLLATLNPFQLPPGVSPGAITAGPDAAMWFTEPTTNKIGRIDTAGGVREFPVPTLDSQPFDIVLGPDNNLWFTEAVGGKIGRINPAGFITEFPIPSGSLPQEITAGPDGALWYTLPEVNRLGRITLSGQFSEFVVPTPNSRPTHIVGGSDNAVWFTMPAANQIGRISTNGSGFTIFQVPTTNAGLAGITLAADGSIWFTESGQDQIGRVGLDNTVTEFPAENPVDSMVPTRPTVITSNPQDGNLYFVQTLTNKVIAINRGGEIVDQTDIGVLNADPQGIASGPNTVWVTLPGAGQIGFIDAGLTVDQAFVQSLYVNELNRLGSVDELNLWVPSLQAISREFVVIGIQGSPEARGVTVRELYGTYLRRPPVNGEEAPWVGALLAGSSEEEVLAGILSSDEFLGRAASLIDNGTPEQRYIRALYSLLFRRSANDQEVLNGVLTIQQTGARVEPALDLLLSLEYRSATVVAYYRDLLNRVNPPRPDELNAWVLSGLDLQRVRIGIEASPEYYING
jgi:virginiamycin B lyase